MTFTPSLSAASSQGPSSKKTHNAAAVSEPPSLAFNLDFLPWRKSSAARRSIEAAISPILPEREIASAEATATGSAGPAGSAYLPSGGALPLRFASARNWPARMMPGDEATLAMALAPDPDVAMVALNAASGATNVGAASGSTGGSIASSSGTAGVVSIVAASADAANPNSAVVSRPTMVIAGESILTSDLVLNALGNLSQGRGAVPVQFQPAVPASNSWDSVPVAVVP